MQQKTEDVMTASLLISYQIQQNSLIFETRDFLNDHILSLFNIVAFEKRDQLTTKYNSQQSGFRLN
jgi:hypothetical protein